MKVIHRFNGWGLPFVAGFAIHAAFSRPSVAVVFAAIVFTVGSITHHLKQA